MLFRSGPLSTHQRKSNLFHKAQKTDIKCDRPSSGWRKWCHVALACFDNIWRTYTASKTIEILQLTDGQSARSLGDPPQGSSLGLQRHVAATAPPPEGVAGSKSWRPHCTAEPRWASGWLQTNGNTLALRRAIRAPQMPKGWNRPMHYKMHLECLKLTIPQKKIEQKHTKHVET